MLKDLKVMEKRKNQSSSNCSSSLAVSARTRMLPLFLPVTFGCTSFSSYVVRVLLEYGVPVASLIFGIMGVYKDLLDNIKTLAVGLATLNTRFDHLDKDVEILKADVKLLKSGAMD